MYLILYPQLTSPNRWTVFNHKPISPSVIDVYVLKSVFPQSMIKHLSTIQIECKIQTVVMQKRESTTFLQPSSRLEL